MSKILDEFFSGLYCPICKTTTEHHIQKIDEEENGEYIAYFVKCDICDHIGDYSVLYGEEEPVFQYCDYCGKETNWFHDEEYGNRFVCSVCGL